MFKGWLVGLPSGLCGQCCCLQSKEAMVRDVLSDARYWHLVTRFIGLKRRTLWCQLAFMHRSCEQGPFRFSFDGQYTPGVCFVRRVFVHLNVLDRLSYELRTLMKNNMFETHDSLLITGPIELLLQCCGQSPHTIG